MKRRVIAFLGAVVTLICSLAIPTFAASLDGVSEEDMEYGQFYQVDVNYRPPTHQDQIRVEWQPWPNGFNEADYQNAWHIHNTQYVYMRVPRDASNNPIGAISIVFEDTDERMWLIRDYSVRFQWWRNEHGTEYEYVSEIVFTNYTGENGDQNMLCFRWSSIDGYGLYDMNKDSKLKDLTGHIALYYNPGDIFGVTTYSSGGVWYGMTNWYTAYGQVKEILTPAFYTGVENATQQGYDTGYADGYYVGGQEAWSDGYAKGYQEGKDRGVTDQANSSKSLKELMFAVVESPIPLVEGMLDFDIFGFNLFNLLRTFITVAVVALIFTFIIKLVV